MPEQKKALKLYLSWAKESQDDKLAMQLKKHLSILEHNQLIKVWDEVGAGFEVDSEQVKQIRSSEIILLLISVDFFSDKDCGEDLKIAIERHQDKNDSAFLIPVMLRKTFMGSNALTKLKILPSENYPVMHRSWGTIDEAFTTVVDEIMKVVDYARRSKDVVTKEVVEDNKLNIVNPSLNDLKDATVVKNVHAFSKGGEIGGIQNIVNDEKEVEIVESFLNKTKDVNGVVVDDIEISRGELLLKKAILLHKSAIRNNDEEKLMEAFVLLEQAQQLEPQNIEILLEMAKILIVLTPDDPTDEEEILEQIELMFLNPKDDNTAFYLAQARYLLATSNLDFIDEDLLKKAKKTFKNLGHSQMENDCKDMLQYAQQKRQSSIPDLPKRQPPTGPSGPPPLPKKALFHPVGEWEIEVHSLIPNTMYLNVFPNGSTNGKQVYLPFAGTWSFQNNYLYIQAYCSGFPFEFAVQVQFEQDGKYHCMGVDGIKYVFKRIVRQTQAQGFYSSGMR